MKRTNAIRIICWVMLLLPLAVLGQNLGVEVHGARGFLLPHRQNMMHLPDGPAHFGELRFFTQTNRDQNWKRVYHQPQIGVSARFFDLANRDILGYGLGIAAYFSSPVLMTERFAWHLELGGGPGFISKPFDYDNNYRNIAIGSYGNFFVVLGQRFTYAMSPRLDLAVAMSFNHFSNAAVALPNLGVNYPMLSVGLSYRPQRIFNDTNDYEDFLPQVESCWTVAGNFGVKQSLRPFDATYPTYSMYGGRQIGLSQKSSINLGGDIFYNAALFHYRNELGEAISALENLQAGLHVAYGLHIGQAVVSVTMGGYVLDSYKRDGFLYHRAGFRYLINEHWGMNISLKTHFFKADYFELGLAYRI